MFLISRALHTKSSLNTKYKSKIMKIFPFDKKLCLPNSYLTEYTETINSFAGELEKFCVNKYIIEKIKVPLEEKDND